MVQPLHDPQTNVMAQVVSGVSFRELPKCSVQLIPNRAFPTVVPLPVKTVEPGAIRSRNTVGDHLFAPRPQA